jgi:hypothetical protein
VEGPTTARVFETYVEEVVLVPRAYIHDRSWCDGQPRSTHTEEDRAADRAAGLRAALSLSAGLLPRLLNPIEEAFAKLKQLLLGKAAARSKEALVEAIAAALYPRSPPQRPRASSSTPDTDRQVSYRETCCRRFSFDSSQRLRLRETPCRKRRAIYQPRSAPKYS